ncbi:MAG: hypothetical protein K0R31_684 [Clostridiales bacterium]|nr:hypothetical protein [Clostridiales bacterium]
MVSGSTPLVGSMFGGPVWLRCLASMGAAIAVKYTLDNPQKAFERVQGLMSPAAFLLRKAILSY